MNRRDITPDTDVLIVGAGPTGLAAAVELTRRGIACRLIDRGERPTELSKAVAVNARTLELMEASGVTERLVGAGVRITRGRFHDRGRVFLDLDLTRIDHPRFNFILAVPQSRTETILEQRLGELGGQVERRTELVRLEQRPEGVEARLEGPGGGETLLADCVLGADGAHSTVRHALGLGFAGRQYEEQWHLADVRLAWDHGDAGVNAFCGDDGAFLFTIEIGGGLHRLIGNRPDMAALLPSGARITETEWTSDFFISRRIVERFAVDRVFLAGDAAHIHPPAGGRGMNLGIEDVWEFAFRAAKGGFEDYDRDRHRTARFVVTQTDRFFRMATTRNPIIRTLRNFASRTFGSIPAAQRAALTAVAGLDPHRRLPDMEGDGG